MQSAKQWFVRAALVLCFTINLTSSRLTTAQESSSDLTTLQQLTQSLVTLSARSFSAQSGAAVAAKQRHDLLIALIPTSPQAALPYMLSADVVNMLPPSAQALIEKEADETGTLEAWYEDYAESHKLRFFLKTGQEQLEVFFATNKPPTSLSGSRVRARGKRLDNFLLLDTTSSTPTDVTSSGGLQVLQLASSQTFGALRTAVLLVNFYDDTSQPYTADQIRSLVFTTVSNFDVENSQDQTWLTGDVFGWFTLPTFSTSTCSLSLATPAQQAAAAAGMDLSGYSRFLYVFPKNACTWLGAASVATTPIQAFINGTATLEAVGHELGHNLGLQHSHSLDCGSATLGTNCSMIEYGDNYDIMGHLTASHFNAFQKERLGWLNFGSSQPITTVTASGTYTITPYETGAGVKALKIVQSTDASTGNKTWYYLEYRQLLGFDTDLSPYPTITNGVLVHLGTDQDPNSSMLLNMNPQLGFDNAALGVGQTYVDAAAGVSVTLTSADASGATVKVALGPGGCQSSAPAITVSPSQGPAVSAGTMQTFAVTVTNQDSVACNTTTFLETGVAPATPTGWSAVITPGSFNLASGSSGSASLQVTSPAGTPAGSYPIIVTAAKWPQYTSSASTSVTYAVGVPVPDFSIVAPSSVALQQGSSAPITATTTAIGGFSAQVSLSASGVPSGMTATFSPTAIAAPGSGMSTLTFQASSSAPPGTYKVIVSGTGGGLTHTLSVSLTITTVPPPSISGYSLFSSTTVPAFIDANAGGPLEMGLRFTSDRNGYIAGIRFYKGPKNVGPHVGTLWTTNGQVLAEATFVNETPSGWQQVNLASPVAIAANKIYVVSYHSSGYYDYDPGTFKSPVDNPPLHAVTTNVMTNGSYSSGASSTFPTSDAGGANLWVDVVFNTGISTASLISITVSPANLSITAGSTQQFQAIGLYSDNSTRDITTQVSWASGTLSVATITSAGLATGVSGGTSLITAELGNISGTATLNVTTAPPPPPLPPPPPSNSYTLFSSTAVPAGGTANAGTPVELGMNFTADRDGHVTGVRFYKASSNVGTHVGTLWSSTGQLLAQAAFTGETASGWQQASFAAPVAITANTIYVISYHTAGYYSYDLGTFNSPVDNSPLHAVLNANNSNGVYAYGASSTFPTSGGGGANFWVDVVFTTSAGTGSASLLSIAVTPANPSIAAGSTQPFQATGAYSDSSMRDLTSQVAWSSGTPTVASISTSGGMATGLMAGSSWITAALGSISGQTLLSVTSAPPPPPSNTFSLFSSTAVPAVLNANAAAPVEVGMKFTADRNGSIIGVRFYKGASNQGTHLGSLWTSTGQLLAQATFLNETPSGWQQVIFSAPVAVVANTVYVVSYHSTGYYSYDLGTFNSPVDNSPLHGVLNSISSNGLYLYSASSMAPTTGAAGANFWVDVLFQ